MLDYLVHPRAGLLVGPLLGALIAAAWEAKRNGASPRALLRTALTVWMPLLVTAALNIVLVTALGAHHLSTEATSTTKVVEAASDVEVVVCAEVGEANPRTALDCLRSSATDLAEGARDAADGWVQGVLLAIAAALAAWFANGAASRGETMSRNSHSRLAVISWQLLIPSAFGYGATVIVYFYGRSVLG